MVGLSAINWRRKEVEQRITRLTQLNPILSSARCSTASSPNFVRRAFSSLRSGAWGLPKPELSPLDGKTKEVIRVVPPVALAVPAVGAVDSHGAAVLGQKATVEFTMQMVEAFRLGSVKPDTLDRMGEKAAVALVAFAGSVAEGASAVELLNMEVDVLLTVRLKEGDWPPVEKAVVFSKGIVVTLAPVDGWELALCGAEEELLSRPAKGVSLGLQSLHGGLLLDVSPAQGGLEVALPQ